MTGGLRRFREPAPVMRAGERCDMCAVPIAEPHAHVVDVRERGLKCVCRPCWLLFTSKGASHGRFRAVPDRFRHDARFALADRVWELTGIPVSMAFVFLQSTVDGDAAAPVAFYPSPAGATESMLRPDAWAELLAGNPEFGDLEPDVEGLLINRREGGFEAFTVPIDVCYELVGHVRAHWKGFDGGTEAWTVINGFFDGLRERAGTTPGAPADAGAADAGAAGSGKAASGKAASGKVEAGKAEAGKVGALHG